MPIEKKTGQLCPECGCTNVKGWMDEVDFTSVTAHCHCRDCGASWTEWYRLDYGGYEYKNKGYDWEGNLEYDDSEEEEDI